VLPAKLLLLERCARDRAERSRHLRRHERLDTPRLVLPPIRRRLGQLRRSAPDQPRPSGARCIRRALEHHPGRSGLVRAALRRGTSGRLDGMEAGEIGALLAEVGTAVAVARGQA
jgi:hypothetical protein